MPPVPKKADWPKESRPVKPNRMSKPKPNNTQTRMLSIVVGVNPRRGSTNGAAISPAAVRASTMNGRDLSMGSPRSFAAGRAEQSVWTQHEHQRHGDEEHDPSRCRGEHGCDS